jgi:hypothetical protein
MGIKGDSFRVRVVLELEDDGGGSIPAPAADWDAPSYLSYLMTS